jgi:hypothetical protein
VSYDGAYPEEDDYDSHGEAGGLDDLDHDDIDSYRDIDIEPNCPATGCYDSGTDWRGRNCRTCNPTPWQRRRSEWAWRAGHPWRWTRRKTRALLRRPTHSSDEPPF